MSKNKLLVRFEINEGKYKQHLRLVQSSQHIRSSVEKLGVCIPFNNNVAKDDMSMIATKCPNLQVLDFCKSNITLAMARIITMNCKRIAHLALGKCEYVNKEMIEIISENCKYLKEIHIPCWLTIKLVWPITSIGYVVYGKKVSSLFGVEIKTYDILHNTNDCKDDSTNSYVIEVSIGLKEVNGVLLSALHVDLFRS